MDHGGSFISEVYRDGQRFHFEAAFTARRWTATIWDEGGHPRGSIACDAPLNTLCADALEDAVCEWVHRAVLHEVGFLLDGRQGLQLLDAPIGTPPPAANASAYGRAVDTGCLPPFDFGKARAAQARSAELREQLGTSMALYLQAARALTAAVRRR